MSPEYVSHNWCAAVCTTLTLDTYYYLSIYYRRPFSHQKIFQHRLTVTTHIKIKLNKDYMYVHFTGTWVAMATHT